MRNNKMGKTINHSEICYGNYIKNVIDLMITQYGFGVVKNGYYIF